MNNKQWLAAAGLSVMACGAQASDFSVGAVAGTLGLGGQVTYAWTERVQTRAMVAGISADVDFEADGGSDLEYSGNVDLLHGALLLDYHPFGGVFRLTGGVMLNDDKIDGSATCEQLACDLGDNESVLVRGDRLDATARYDSVSPYIGFGWGKSPGAEGGLGFSADIGVFYLGEPDVDVRLSGASSANPIARDAVEEEQDDIQDDLDKLPLYPVVMLGVDYRF
ncbi:outer membrane protein domain-containing protein [Salinisphaera sp. T5B8]|uniref:hypothetical protein n=1 Tax=Salinisphaera sp. T5B8 TaxID=1304154 RepID=UPI0033407889